MAGPPAFIKREIAAAKAKEKEDQLKKEARRLKRLDNAILKGQQSESGVVKSMASGMLKVMVKALWWQPEVGGCGYLGALRVDGVPFALCSKEKWDMGPWDSLRKNWSDGIKIFNKPKALYLDLTSEDLQNRTDLNKGTSLELRVPLQLEKFVKVPNTEAEIAERRAFSRKTFCEDELSQLFHLILVGNKIGPSGREIDWQAETTETYRNFPDVFTEVSSDLAFKIEKALSDFRHLCRVQVLKHQVATEPHTRQDCIDLVEKNMVAQPKKRTGSYNND
jgi:hypothetical protein